MVLAVLLLASTLAVLPSLVLTPEPAQASASGSSYFDTVDALEPLGYWRLTNTGTNSPNEGRSTTAFQNSILSTRGEDGALLGDTGNKAYGFSKGGSVTSGQIEDSAYPFDPDRMTLEAWIKVTDTSPVAGNILETRRNNGGEGLSIDLDASLVPTLTATMASPDGNSETDFSTTGSAMSGNEWHHIVGVGGDGVVDLWVDGVIVGRTLAPGHPNVAGASWVSAGSTAPVGSMHLDEVALYDEVLTPSQIQGNYIASGRQPAVTLSEMFGPNGALRNQHLCQGCEADPVDVLSGNLHMPLPGIAVPGRGLGLQFSLGYNSLAAGTDSRTGFGWSSTLDMRIEVSGEKAATVYQETGSTVPFTEDGGSWTAPDRFIASLDFEANGSGTADDEWVFTRRHFETFTFDVNGRLKSMSDQFDNTTTLTYPNATSTEASSMTDEGGRSLTFEWDAGRLDKVKDPLLAAEGGPRVVDLGYDGNGDLTTYQDWSGGTWVFTYDGDHRMWKMRKPRHSDPAKVIENSYDPFGRVEWQKDERGRQTTIEYDTPSVGETKVTLPGGRVRVHKFVDGRREEVITGYGTPDAVSTKIKFDPGTYAVTTVEDNDGNVTTSEDTDNDGNVDSVEDPTGRITRFTYNDFDQVELAKTGEFRTGPGATSVAEEVVTKNEYDSTNGRLLKTTQAFGTPKAAETSFTYDTTHPEDLREVNDARGEIWKYTYDPDTGYQESAETPELDTTETDYNTIGWPETVTTPEGVASAAVGDYQTTYSYNIPTRTTTVTGPTGDKSVSVLDANGNLASSTTGVGGGAHTTSYEYTDADELKTVTFHDNTTKSYEYWPTGERRKFTNELGAETEYTYDDAGRLESRIDPNDLATTYLYDDASRLEHVQQPIAGATCDTGVEVGCITYSYDAAGRPTGVDYSDPATPDVSNITYDGLGRRTAATASGVTELWGWNVRSQLTSTKDGNGRTTGYDWDGNGNLTKITYPGLGDVVREFDKASRLEKITQGGRVTEFDYDADSNWEKTTFPAAPGTPSPANTDVYDHDEAGRITSVEWWKGAAGTTSLGSETYTRPTSTKGMIDATTPAGAAGSVAHDNNYDSRDRLETTGVESFDLDAASNLIETSDGRLQVFDPSQQLCWSSPTATGGTCDTPAGDATTFDYDPLGNRTQMVAPSGNTSTYTYDQANRLTEASVPDAGIQTEGQYRALTPGASRVADSTNGTTPGTCGGGSCVRLTASQSTDVQVLGVGNVPASGVVAVTGTITAINPGADGAIRVNPNGNAAAAEVAYLASEDQAGTFIAEVDGNGRITISTNQATDFSIDIAGYYSTPSLVPGSNFWPVAAERFADTRSGSATGTCDGGTCATLTANQTVEIDAAGVGSIPSDVTAVVASIIVLNNTGDGTITVSPSGAASAGTITYESGKSDSGVITAPVDGNGRITLHTDVATDVVVDVAGWYATPTAGDSGNALTLMPSATQVTDTANSIGTCGGVTCTTLTGATATNIAIAGQNGVPTDIAAAVVNIAVPNPAGNGFFAANLNIATGGGASASLIYETGVENSTSAVIPVAEDGTISIYTTTAIDITIDVVGTFARPIDTYNYTYDSGGLRTTKAAAGGTPIEFTWDRSGGLPLLIGQHTGANSSYIIYGPGGTPIYQIQKNGEPLYYHQDQLGSTRMVTKANGNQHGAITYDAYGKTLTDTTPWYLERPILGYAGQYHDHETGFQYLRARHYDTNTGQFISRDPIVSMTEEPYGYVSGNPANGSDPSGLIGLPFTIPEAIPVIGGSDCIKTGPDDDSCETPADEFKEDHPEVAQGVVDFAGGVLSVNPITATTNALGRTDTSQCSNTDSGWFKGGMVSMIVVDAWAAGGLGAARFRDSSTFGKSSTLFGRGGKAGGGILNSSVVRIGWGWKGSAKTGQDVFRIAVGHRKWHLEIWEVGRALRGYR